MIFTLVYGPPICVVIGLGVDTLEQAEDYAEDAAALSGAKVSLVAEIGGVISEFEP